MDKATKNYRTDQIKPVLKDIKAPYKAQIKFNSGNGTASHWLSITYGEFIRIKKVLLNLNNAKRAELILLKDINDSLESFYNHRPDMAGHFFGACLKNRINRIIERE